MTLVAANLAVLVVIAIFLFRLLREIGDFVSACAATIVFLTLFAFAELESYGNSNYVTPYAHETTHGTLIALAALFVLARWIESRDQRRLILLGLLLGLSFL